MCGDNNYSVRMGNCIIDFGMCSLLIRVVKIQNKLRNIVNEEQKGDRSIECNQG